MPDNRKKTYDNAKLYFEVPFYVDVAVEDLKARASTFASRSVRFF